MNNQITTCPVCGNGQCRLTSLGARWGTPVHDCPRCGRFVLVGPAHTTIVALLERGKLDRSVLSHIIRKSQRDTPLEIFQEDLPAYRNLGSLPTPREQSEAFILCVGNNQVSPEAWASNATNEALAASIGSRISANEGAFQWLLNEIKDEGWFTIHPSGIQGRPAFRLSIKGWNLHEELRRRTIVSRNAFMAMQFGDATLEAMLEKCFKPAVARAGFELRPLYEGQGAGLIDNQIRTAIRAARFVIADLSHDNNGAYFEAGFAEGLGLPVIYTCERNKFDEKKTHFDTNHMVTVPWEAANMEDAASRLTATIRNTLPGEATRD